MPELPEVETIRRDLEKKILSKKIREIEIKNLRTIKNTLSFFKNKLRGAFFSKIARRGKLLIFEISEKKFVLLLHLKMTGQLVYCDEKICLAGGHSLSGNEKNTGIGGDLPNKHTRVVFIFEDGSKLYFNDLRKFGYFKIIPKNDLKSIEKNFGIEPLSPGFTLESFGSLFLNRKTNIKAFLLNQKLIAGIGNIYADEILFDSGILPNRPVNEIERAEIKRLFNSTNKIFKKAIKHRGTTFNNYVDGSGKKGNFIRFLKVYGKKGERCAKCGKGIIKKIKIAQRGTSYCDFCQK